MDIKLKAVILRIPRDTYYSRCIRLSLNGAASIINSQHNLVMTRHFSWLVHTAADIGVCDYDYMNGTECLYVCNNGTTATGICGAKPTFQKTRILCWCHPCSESSRACNSFRQKGTKKLKITFEVCRMRKSPTCRPSTWTAAASSAAALLVIHAPPPNTTQQPSWQKFLRACDCPYPG